MVGRDVYVSGRYVQHFTPESERNPFRSLYARKRSDVVEAVRSSLVPGASLLDLGGGPGRIAAPLAAAYRVTLADLSADMLATARKTAGIGAVQLDAGGRLPFSNAVFDGALCIDLLPHLPRPGPALAELRRVLRPGATLLVDASNRSPWWLLRYPRALGRRPARWWPTWRAGGVWPEWQQNVRHFRYDEFKGLLAATGFEPVREWRYGPEWCPKWFLAQCEAPR